MIKQNGRDGEKRRSVLRRRAPWPITGSVGASGPDIARCNAGEALCEASVVAHGEGGPDDRPLSGLTLDLEVTADARGPFPHRAQSEGVTPTCDGSKPCAVIAYFEPDRIFVTPEKNAQPLAPAWRTTFCRASRTA